MYILQNDYHNSLVNTDLHIMFTHGTGTRRTSLSWYSRKGAGQLEGNCSPADLGDSLYLSACQFPYL